MRIGAILEKNNQKSRSVFWGTGSRNLRFAFVLNLIVLGLAVSFGQIKYEVSDDFIMAGILSGAFGTEPDPHMLFINVIWGYMLLPFYHLFPEISWYLIFQLLLCFFSLTALVFFVLQRAGKTYAITLSALLIVGFSNDLYLVVQFTKTAMIAVMSGSLLFLSGFFNADRKKWSCILLGGALVVLGSLVRFDVIGIAGLFLTGILVFEFVQLKKRSEDTKAWIKSCLPVVFGGVILIGIVFAAKGYDSWVYSNDEEYRYFRAYSQARSFVVDSASSGYESMESEFLAAGISKNDYQMMRKWNFADPDYFTLERMQEAGSIIAEDEQAGSRTVLDICKRLWGRQFWGYPAFWACFCLFGVAVFWGKHLWPFVIGSGVLGIFYMIYFVLRGHVVYRVEYSVFLSVFLAALYFFDEAHWKPSLRREYVKKWVFRVLGAVLAGIQVCMYIPDCPPAGISSEERKTFVEDVFYESWRFDGRRYRRQVKIEDGNAALLQEVKEHPNNFYFFDFSTTIQTLYLDYDPLIRLPVGFYHNSLYLGGIMTALPSTITLLNKNGLENPLKSLVKENVYLVDNLSIEDKLQYLQEHYYPEARAELCSVKGGYQIWKFYVS
ncbi:hypothetical protein [Hominifimenecus sp. rT4P-3]|uniref:hypothetical protein n=1 Tax=Hominifimenecus sp. rT4P-3 TaxID=3242979 RepID=UPI003DA45945